MLCVSTGCEILILRYSANSHPFLCFFTHGHRWPSQYKWLLLLFINTRAAFSCAGACWHLTGDAESVRQLSTHVAVPKLVCQRYLSAFLNKGVGLVKNISQMASFWPQISSIVCVIGLRGGLQFCRPQKSWDACLPYHLSFCPPILTAAKSGPPFHPLSTPLPQISIESIFGRGPVGGSLQRSSDP